MRDIDDEFDSTDVVRYVPAPVRAIEDEATQPVSVSMVMPSFDDSELEAVLAQLVDEEQHKGDYFARRK